MRTMPLLRPLPIETKGRGLFHALWVWIITTRKWEVYQDFHYVLPSGDLVCIPAGFVFDGASVPKYFRSWLSPMGILLIPGLIHDYAYKRNLMVNQNYTPILKDKGRKYWDKVFRDIAIEVNGFKLINYLAWLALVIGGWIAWNKHRRSE